MNKTAKVIVGLSGGVDSSVSALRLKQQGYDVEAVFMKNWNDDDGTEYCTARQDLLDAMEVAAQIGIELHTISFSESYWDNVFAHFLSEYQAGRTPNPDILCNKEIKFKAFLNHALTLGADYIATGHYARTNTENGSTYLLKGLDPNKDQSYFLHAVDQNALARSLFPIGELDKNKVREVARQYGLATKNKKDSTGICFIGERKFKDFLQRYIPAQPGAIHDLQGNYLGQHSGLMYHTIGQRQGLGIGGVKGAGEAPWYVIDKDLNNNVLIVGQGIAGQADELPELYKTSLQARQAYWINRQPKTPFPCHAKIRYRQPDQACTVLIKPDRTLIVHFEKSQRAITPGQSIVFYQGETCLGGAIIECGFNQTAKQAVAAEQTVTGEALAGETITGQALAGQKTGSPWDV